MTSESEESSEVQVNEKIEQAGFVEDVHQVQDDQSGSSESSDESVSD